MFTLRDYNTIVAGMISQLTSLDDNITDYTEGSVARSLMEALASEIQRVEFNAFMASQEAIQTGTYKNFNFNRLPATYTSGNVTFTLSNASSMANTTIPANTIVSVPGTSRQYATATTVTILEGQTSVVAFVSAAVPGVINNTPQNTVTQINSVLTLPGDVSGISVNNASDFSNGTAQESDDARSLRFKRYIAGLSKGTPQAIEAAALGSAIYDSNGNIIEKAVNAAIFEGFLTNEDLPLGLVNVYVDNGSAYATPNLLAAVRNSITGYTDNSGIFHPGVLAAGCNLNVFAVVPLALIINAVVQIAPAYDGPSVAANVAQAMNQYISTLNTDDPAELSQLFFAALGVPGVLDISFIGPTSNTVPKTGQRCVVGSITISTILAQTPASKYAFATIQGASQIRGYAATSPSVGSYSQGDIFLNSNPTSGGYVGWICTVAGSPGTWNTFGVIS